MGHQRVVGTAHLPGPIQSAGVGRSPGPSQAPPHGRQRGREDTELHKFGGLDFCKAVAVAQERSPVSPHSSRSRIVQLHRQDTVELDPGSLRFFWAARPGRLALGLGQEYPAGQAWHCMPVVSVLRGG